jgi:hypothetical protein
LPLVLLASYAVWLRVAQYGWTVERVFTAATILIALCYTFGYAAAALFSLAGGAWMRLVAPVNVATAFAVIAVLLALFTPLADPARLSVASQVERLRSSAVSAKAFDFAYLNAEGGRYGHDALVALARADFGSATATVRSLAGAALVRPAVSTPKPAGPADVAANVTVYPHGAALPGSFVQQDWVKVAAGSESAFLPSCLHNAGSKCDAFLMDFDGDGRDDVMIVEDEQHGASGPVYREQPDGHWKAAGRVMLPACGGAVFDALRRGRYALVPRVDRDLRVNGVTFQFYDFGAPVQVCH